MSETTIRPAQPADADRLTALIQASTAYRGAYFAMIDGYLVKPDYVERHEVRMAVDDTDDRLLGFYALIHEPAELDLMFVADEAQGLGIGRALITDMLARARAAGIATVKVVSHPPAEGFYLQVGAERTGTRPPRPKTPWEQPELRFTV
ncbi:GNAT family N-acetyltransferase [Streptomyces sp. CBMA123]|uniref:GNAT family N-acetyltransferase n=1 Tax=Streptomyces sp. CBMA123 TaxID=1896313 RepID=UPI00166206F0|nr:GNAT family N-acetyltransferase [Streptomyces sp. CBMA123]MBD0689834.1 GNAT family N-acetyltransferase [Streptomyces sp. CBMA123]